MSKRPSLFSFIDFYFFQNDGGLYSEDPYLLFVAELHRSFESSMLASRATDYANHDAVYKWPGNLGFYRLKHKNTFDLFSRNLLQLKSIKSQLMDQVKGYDNLLLCWPHPVSYLIAREFEGKKNIILLVRQNQQAITRAKYSGWKRRFAMTGLKLLDRAVDSFKDRLQLITVGNEMNMYYQKEGYKSSLIADSLISNRIRGVPRNKPTSSIKLLYVGRLEKEKGVDILLSAAVNWKEAGLELQINIIGSGSQKNELKLMAEKLGLVNTVSFVGHVRHGDELYGFFREADLLVIPSRTEGFPKTIHESRAFGLPILATPVGGMKLELQHGKNVWFAKASEPEALADALLDLLNSKGIYEDMSKYLLDEFDESSMESAIEKYYKKITG